MAERPSVGDSAVSQQWFALQMGKVRGAGFEGHVGKKGAKHIV